MAAIFPRFVLLKMVDMKESVFAYREGANSVALESEEGVFNPLAKIEVERAKINSSYVHLRFCQVNRYCGVSNTNSDGIGFVVAESKAAEEDTSKLSCTLFEPSRADSDGSFYLTHVHTGWRVQMQGRLFIAAKVSGDRNKFGFVDWSTVVKLPEHVAFKGDNGKYLQAHWQDDIPYLQFSSDDAYDRSSGFRVEHRPDGHVRVKSDHFGKFWRLKPNWIWADEERHWDLDRSDDAFWPVRIDKDTIALRNATYNNYCVRLPDIDWKIDCLNAAVSTITKEARLAVMELVQERKIYSVMYRMEDARIFDETPYVAGKTTVYNKADVEAGQQAEVSFEKEESYTFTKGVSLTAGVKTEIKTGMPFIVEGKVEISSELTGNMEWSHTETSRKTVRVATNIPVPARSVATVSYVGTMGSCNVPFSYTQQDTSSVDGRVTYSVQNDGMYTGVSCYNFQFIIEKIHPLLV